LKKGFKVKSQMAKRFEFVFVFFSLLKMFGYA
jgi:hypothetical protein